MGYEGFLMQLLLADMSNIMNLKVFIYLVSLCVYMFCNPTIDLFSFSFFSTISSFVATLANSYAIVSSIAREAKLENYYLPPAPQVWHSSR